MQEYKVAFLDEGGAESQVRQLAELSPPPSAAHWTQNTLPGLVAPAGAVSALIQIVGKTGAVEGGLGEVLIDDVSLQSVGLRRSERARLAATVTPTVEISWPSKTGQDYQVQSSADLSAWSNFGGVITGNGSIKAVYDTMIDKKFYRVGELP